MREEAPPLHLTLYLSTPDRLPDRTLIVARSARHALRLGRAATSPLSLQREWRVLGTFAAGRIDLPEGVYRLVRETKSHA